jgi:hypothetical protein
MCYNFKKYLIFFRKLLSKSRKRRGTRRAVERTKNAQYLKNNQNRKWQPGPEVRDLHSSLLRLIEECPIKKAFVPDIIFPFLTIVHSFFFSMAFIVFQCG